MHILSGRLSCAIKLLRWWSEEGVCGSCGRGVKYTHVIRVCIYFRLELITVAAPSNCELPSPAQTLGSWARIQLES
jgi:hypothetical protein